MRNIFICLTLLSLVGCSTSKPTNKVDNDSKNIARRATISENKSAEVLEVFTAKPLPVLGDAMTQSRFALDDSMARLKDEPRPTYPETLAVLAGNPPSGVDVCNLSYSALIMKIYQECISEGMSPIEVSNILGWSGTEASTSGSTVIYTWRNHNEGIMTATFKDNRLISKSQVGLE